MLKQADSWAREPDLDIGIFGKAAPKTRNRSIVNGARYHSKIYRELAKLTLPEGSRLHIEPWLRNQRTRKLLQPDFVILDELTHTALVGEVKLNWKDGRDEKLLQHYLWAAQSAWGLEATWPVLVTSNVAHLNREPRLGLRSILDADDWSPGDPCPVVLVL